MYRRNQSFYFRIAKNNKIKNVLINIFLMFEEINFFVINFINMFSLKSSSIFSNLNIENYIKSRVLFLINLLNKLYIVSLLFSLYLKLILILKSILKIKCSRFFIILSIKFNA